VQDAQQDLYYAVEAYTEADHALEDARMQAIIDGQIVGKNSEEREAKAATVLQEQIGAHRVTAAKVRHANMMLDKAALNLDAVRYTIRLMEVTRASTIPPRRAGSARTQHSKRNLTPSFTSGKPPRNKSASMLI
jgi:hypothetical protein